MMNFPVRRTLWVLGVALALVALAGFECDNNPPALAPIGELTITAGAPFSLQLAAGDPDGDELTFYAEGLPPESTFDPATGLFQYAPTFWDLQVWQIVFGVTDGEAVDEETIGLHVVADTDFVEIYLEPDALSLNVGEEQLVLAYGVRADGDVAEDIYVNWVNGDEAVAFMDFEGYATGVAPGTTTAEAWLITPETLNDSVEITVTE
jgi:large repetitive protein